MVFVLAFIQIQADSMYKYVAGGHLVGVCVWHPHTFGMAQAIYSWLGYGRSIFIYRVCHFRFGRHQSFVAYKER